MSTTPGRPGPDPADRRAGPAADDRTWPIDPGDALLDGRFDPIALLVAWCAHKAFFPLLWVGAAVASTFAAEAEGPDPDGLDLGNSAGDLFSPFAGIVLAFGLRVVAAAVGFVLAYRVTAAHVPPAGSAPQTATPGSLRARAARVPDLVHLTRGLRSLRWTGPVRAEAARRGERAGQVLEQVARGIGIAGWAVLPPTVIVLFATGALVLGG